MKTVSSMVVIFLFMVLSLWPTEIPGTRINFTKMHGCQNDFIMIYEREKNTFNLLAQNAKRLCNRRSGIGADGIILIGSSQKADYRMRIINADGSFAQMCGNGIRCAQHFLNLQGIDARKRILFETGAGMIETHKTNGLIRVNMGRPVLEGARIPTKKKRGYVTNFPLSVGDRKFIITAVSMGNPHAVIFMPKLSDDLVLGWGSQIESHPFFPERVNVEFIRVISRQKIEMRVFERGVGETMACGTGACAAVVAGIQTGRLSSHVTVVLRGGTLNIRWAGKLTEPVYLTGPAEPVFSGYISLSKENFFINEK